MPEFSNYNYLHNKYLVEPNCRSSSVNDLLGELEVTLIMQWEYNYKDIFAKAKIKEGQLDFLFVDNKIVDNQHLKLEDLIQKFKKSLKDNQPY